MPPRVVILIDALHSEGAENVAVAIAVNLRRRGRFEPIVCATRWGGVLEEVLKKNDVSCLLLNRRSALHVHKFLPLRKLIKKENARLIHAHKVGSNFWGSLVGKSTGVPVISHFHSHQGKAGRRSAIAAARLAGRLSCRIVAISEYERKRLIEDEGLPAEKLVTIYNGIDLARYRTSNGAGIRDELGIDEHAPVIGIVAAFRLEKNHRLFVDAAAVILETYPSAVFVFVGDGELRSDVERYAEEKGVAPACRFTGFRKDVDAIISGLDVGVLCSDWEGLPLVLLEYMASAKPVVSTNVSGVSEVVEDGASGFLVSPGDRGALAEKIIELLANEDLRRRFGDRGRRVVTEKFSDETMMQRVHALYEETLSPIGAG